MAVEGAGGRAGQPDAIVAPVNPHCAAVGLDHHPPPGQAAQMGGHRHSTGARAAGQRDAGAAFPHPHSKVVGADARGKRDIGGLREQRVMFGGGTTGGQINRLGIIDKEHAMGVAHADADRVAFDRKVKGIAISAQRYLGPAQQRRPHVDAGQAVASIFGHQHAAFGAQRQPRQPTLRQFGGGDAAGGVAAGPGHRAIGIVECQRQIGIGAMVDHRQLVKPDTAMAVADGAHQPSRQRQRPGPLVQHHKVIAQPVHLDERQPGFGPRHSHAAPLHPARQICQTAWIIPDLLLTLWDDVSR